MENNQNQALLASKQKENESIEQEIREAIKKLPLEQRLQLVALNSHLLTKMKQDEDLQLIVNEISEKYIKFTEPCLNNINQIIAGEKAPTLEEVNSFKEHLTAEELAQAPENLKAEAIPEYWYKVLTSCVRLERFIFEHDHPILKKITKIEQGFVEKNKLDFTITFHFAPNDYFENTSMTATFVVDSDEVVEKIIGCDVKWKEGKNVTEKLVKKRKKNKKTGKHENIMKAEEVDSFFNLFKSIDSTVEDKNQTEEEKDLTLMRLQERNQIAMFIRGDIIIHHLSYCLGLRTGEEAEDFFGDQGAFQAYDDEDIEEDALTKLQKKFGKK